MAYLQQLRRWISSHGSQDIAYIDESGFVPEQVNPYGYSRRGKIIFGDHSGQRRPRTNLLVARYQGRLQAPMLLEGSVTAEVFEAWLEQWLLPSLDKGSLLVMDNAAFHRKAAVRELAKRWGHEVLFLPPYSPDYNKVEHDFGALKKLRCFYPAQTPIDAIILEYQERREAILLSQSKVD